MSKINPNANQLIQDYIHALPKFSHDICTQLYELMFIARPDAIEDWKWRTPVFHGRTMVCGFAGFKKHVSLSFFHGAHMQDNYQLFSEDCNAQNSRTIKFGNVTEIDNEKVLSYLKEAFDLSEKAIRKKTKPKTFVMPKLLSDALSENKLAQTNFDAMAYSYRKEYAEHIATAKRETTQLRRLKKVTENLEKNIKLNDHYKC